MNENENLEQNISSSDQNDQTNDSASAPEKNLDKKWYALQCLSLHEYKVKKRIEDLIESDYKGKIFRVLLPEEETVEIKNNSRREKVAKIYPGYVFVEMLPEKQLWHVVKRLNGVMRLIGDKDKPVPVEGQEIDKILSKVGERKIEVDFEVDEMIKVILGPFRGYAGKISEIFPDRGKVKALISIFGRDTPVELDFDQVEKASESHGK